jgi:hypothetical protein
MDGTYLLFGYMGVGILLGIRAKYLYERLLRYIDKQYPEQGTVIRSSEWQCHPWSVGARTLQLIVEKEAVNDPELAYRARKAGGGRIHFLGWFFLAVLTAFSVVVYHLLTAA